MDSTPTPPNQFAESDARMWATFVHLGIVAGWIIPLATILVPLIIWLVQKDKSAFVDRHGRAALNFQLTMIIGFVIAGILTLIYIGVFLIAALAVLDLVFSILAAVAANKGEEYKYPFSLELVK